MRLSQRAGVGVRFLLLGGVLVGAAGVAAHYQGWPWLQATLGPTAYVFAAHPETNTARLRNAAVGHATAVACGLFALAVFGLWTHPSTASAHQTTLRQAFASAIALGLTLFVLEMARTHHAPAGATAILVSSGLARPYTPLYGLLLGLTMVIVLGALITKVPLERAALAPPKQR